MKKTSSFITWDIMWKRYILGSSLLCALGIFVFEPPANTFNNINNVSYYSLIVNLWLKEQWEISLIEVDAW